jgi:secondary thiamine-phosphate synthase enzyme
MIVSTQLALTTRGDGEITDITDRLLLAIRESGLAHGIVTVFCPSATSGITTIEYESGAVSDFQRLFDEIAPPDREYRHNLRWQDGNGHSHVRAALLGPSLTIPFVDRRLTLGTWQQVVYVDFDNRQRQRRLVVQIMGEA